VTAALLAEIGGVLATTLGWSAEQLATEVERTTRILHDAHGVDLAASPVTAPSGVPAATTN
jgi:glycerol-3-phosphate dehydrogenase